MISILFVPASGTKIPDDLNAILKKKGERTFKVLRTNQWGHSTYRGTLHFDGNIAKIAGDQQDMVAGSFVGWIIRNASHISSTFIMQLE